MVRRCGLGSFGVVVYCCEGLCCIFIYSIKVGKYLLALDCNCALKNENVLCLPILREI